MVGPPILSDRRGKTNKSVALCVGSLQSRRGRNCKVRGTDRPDASDRL